MQNSRDTKRTAQQKKQDETETTTDREHEVIILQINRRNRYARLLRYRIVRFP